MSASIEVEKPILTTDEQELFNSLYPSRGRRSKFEIKMDLLAAIEHEPLPTSIMYVTRLSWKPLIKLLKELEDRQLVEKIWSSEKDARVKFIYRITDKGKRTLELYKTIEI